MLLKKKIVSSNASRKVFSLDLKWQSFVKFKKRLYKRKSNAGRNCTGQRVIRTKGAILHKYFNPILNYKRLAIVSIILSLYVTPKLSSIHSLMLNSNGSLSYNPKLKNLTIFNFSYPKVNKNYLSYFYTQPTHTYLIYVKNWEFISFLTQKPSCKPQYVKTPGCCAILINKNFLNYTALLKLPSGVRKVFPLHTLINFGAVSFSKKNKLLNTKSGFYRTYGIKSLVRGVAMNPVDHPHGGRTKSIKYPRTPWSLTTKFK